MSNHGLHLIGLYIKYNIFHDIKAEQSVINSEIKQEIFIYKRLLKIMGEVPKNIFSLIASSSSTVNSEIKVSNEVGSLGSFISSIVFLDFFT